MDQLEIQGKKYISSKRAAELTGYAKDYVGQLIREGKITGVRFGRAWFLDENEILTHAGLKELEKHAIKNEIEKYPAAPIGTPLARPHLKLLTSGEYKSPRLPSTWSQIQYSYDESDLIPRLTEKVEILSENQIEVKSEGDKKVNIISSASNQKPRIEPKKVVTNFSRDRMKVLVDGIAPHSAVIRVAAPQPLPKPSSERRNLSQRRPSLMPMIPVMAVGTFAIVSLALGLSGIFFSSQTAYIAGNTAYTANVLAGLENIAPVLEEGTKALTNFFKTLGSSFIYFITIAISFFGSLFHSN